MPNCIAPVSGEPTEILEDFVDEGAISAYLAPSTYLAYMETNAGISNVKCSFYCLLPNA